MMSTQKPNTQSLLKSVKFNQEEKIKAQTDMAYDELVLDKNRSVSVLPEHIFVSYFLPFLCGERPLSTDRDFFNNWNSIAGAPTKPINIIDASNNVLFQVPPLVDTSFVNPKDTGNMDFNTVMINYHLLNNNIKSQAQNFIVNAMVDKSNFGKAVNLTANEKAMFDIFIRYGKVKETPHENNQKNNSDKFSDDELTFE